MPGQRPGRGDLAQEAAPVAVGEQHPVVHLERHLPADGGLEREVDDPEATLPQHAPDLIAGNRYLGHARERSASVRTSCVLNLPKGRQVCGAL